MSDRIVYAVLVITAIFTLTSWDYSLTELSNVGSHRKYLNMKSHSKTSSNSKATTEKPTCGFEWFVNGFDPKFYEMKLSMWNQQAPINGIRHVPKPVVINPSYPMDPNRYLLPILEGGPNNQVFCIRETIFMAIKLNRTLVIPKFNKHFTDSQSVGVTYIYPGHRINLKTICKLISCISLKDFQNTCNGQVDAVMTFRDVIETDTIEAQAGMNLKSGARDSRKVKVLYHVEPGDRRGKVYSDDIQRTFDSQDRCIVYQRPLFNLLIAATTKRNRILRRPVLSALSGFPDEYKSDDISQIIDITRKTQAPEYIGHLADSFIRFLVKKRPFVAVHWRYNKGDFSRRCDAVLSQKSKGPESKRQYCLRVMNLTAEDVAHAIVFNVTRNIMKLRKNPITVKDIYVAAPPSERGFLREVGKILRKTQRWNVYTSAELEKYLKKNNNCDLTRKHMNDILSTLEMEICARGLMFLKTSTSTWSENVGISRKFCKRQGTFPELDSNFV